MRIIVDVMGGDKAPAEILKGVMLADAEYSANFILVGNENIINELAKENGYDLRRFEIVHTDEVITMEDDPLSVVRAKSGSSMGKALKLLAEGSGDALVSAGNTGALFTGATLIVRKIKGIQRAALASILPFTDPVLLVDSGANVTVKEEHLEQFAFMGSIYMNKVHGIESPRIGLLNNGTEDCKGTALQIETYKRLSSSELNFVGNIEGNMIATGGCDVLVCDGFTGNVVLKHSEGMGKMMMGAVKDVFLKNQITKLTALVLRDGIRTMKKRFDAAEYGGAPFLGISRPVIKAHGSSDAKAIKNAVRQAISYANTGVIYEIAKATQRLKEEKTQENNE